MITVITDTGEIIDMQFATPYNHDTLERARAGALVCNDKSLTDQSFKEDADINVIIDKILKSGKQVDIVLPEHFGIDNRVDLHEARSQIAKSNATFYNLDPRVREEFNHDPARWEQQVLKDLYAGNVDNLKRMGIQVEKRPAEPPKAATPAAAAAGGSTPPPEPPKAPEPPKN